MKSKTDMYVPSIGFRVSPNIKIIDVWNPTSPSVVRFLLIVRANIPNTTSTVNYSRRRYCCGYCCCCFDDDNFVIASFLLLFLLRRYGADHNTHGAGAADRLVAGVRSNKSIKCRRKDEKKEMPAPCFWCDCYRSSIIIIIVIIAVVAAVNGRRRSFATTAVAIIPHHSEEHKYK